MVPSFEDVEHSQRELAERGAVFGARVVRFAWLYELIARAGRLLRARGVGPPAAADRGAARCRAADLEVLAASAERPGFARAAERFVAELEKLDGRGAALHPRHARLGRRRPAAALRGRGGGGVPPLPRGSRRRRPGRLRPVRVAGPGGARARARALGRDAGLLLRVRRLHAARARGAARAGRPRGCRRDRLAPVRARPRGVQGHGESARGAGGDGRRGHAPGGDLRPLRGRLAPRAPRPGARPVRDRRRRGRPGRRRPGARGGRRARRAGAVRRGGARSC